MQLGLCYSPLKLDFATALAQRLERNLGISTLMVELDSDPIYETWEQASAAGAVLLLLDNASAPLGPVNRDQWQSLLDHNSSGDQPPVAILRFGTCQYPKLLERTRFLAPQNDLEAARWVERWLVERMASRQGALFSPVPGTHVKTPPADWWTQTVDQPGTLHLTPDDIDAAQVFACDAAAHFQEVFWIGCDCVPPEVLAAEIESRSASAIDARCLFILVYAPKEIINLSPRRRHSFLILEGSPPLSTALPACRSSGFPGILMDLITGNVDWQNHAIPLLVSPANYRWFRVAGSHTSAEAIDPTRHTEVLLQTFRAWRRQPDLCRELVGEAANAIHHQRPESVPELRLDLALFLLHEKRLGEAIAWLRILVASPANAASTEFVQRAQEELSWLVDQFGAPLPRPAAPGNQLDFDFPAEFFQSNGVDLSVPEAEDPDRETTPPVVHILQLKIDFPPAPRSRAAVNRR